MKCLACGAELPEGTIFCTSCGTKLEPVQDAFKQPAADNFSQPDFQQPAADNFSQPDFQQPSADNFSQTSYDQPAPAPYAAAPQSDPYGAVPQSAPYSAPVKPAVVDPGKNLGIASLILGIISVVFTVILGFLSFFFIPTNLVSIGCGIAGIVTGSKAKKACEAAGVTPSGMAKGGFICSAIGLVLGALLTVAIVGFFLIILLSAMSG